MDFIKPLVQFENKRQANNNNNNDTLTLFMNNLVGPHWKNMFKAYDFIYFSVQVLLKTKGDWTTMRGSGV